MNWLAHLRRSLWLRRLLGALGLGTALLLCPLPVGGGAAWDLGMGLGYAALIFAALLYLYPLRGEGLPHRRLFTLSQHRRIGWLALACAALHIATLLIAEPLTSRYLLPSAPLYMLSGLASLIALAILVASGLSARSSLRARAQPTSVYLHSALAALLLALIAAHILGSHQLIDTGVKALTLRLLLVVPLLWTIVRAIRHRIRAATRLLTTVIPCSAGALTLLLLPLPTGSSTLLEPVVTPSTLPIYFPHEKHTTVNCVTCHHNFIDRTGIGSCIDCHRRPRPDLIWSAQAIFHPFCRDCHSELARTSAKHGPTRSCAACHARPTTTAQAAVAAQQRTALTTVTAR